MQSAPFQVWWVEGEHAGRLEGRARVVVQRGGGQGSESHRAVRVRGGSVQVGRRTIRIRSPIRIRGEGAGLRRGIYFAEKWCKDPRRGFASFRGSQVGGWLGGAVG